MIICFKIYHTWSIMNKKLIIPVLVMFITISQTIPTNTAYAKETNINKVNKVLSDFGYNQELINGLPQSEKEKIATAIEENPESVSTSTCIMEVDNIAEIESIVNCDDEDLISAGVSKDKIKVMRDQIDELIKLSDSELVKEYELDQTEIKVLRKALTENPNYKSKAIDDPVQASGSVTGTEMSFTQSMVDYSVLGVKASYYYNCFYNWSQVFFLNAYSDKIAIAWGGNLAQTGHSSIANYYSYGTSWGSRTHDLTPSFEEGPINAGAKFTFPQSSYYGAGLSKVKHGYAALDLYQNGNSGTVSKIISTYCHQTLVVTTGINISISGGSLTPEIGVGLGYDSSPQLEKVIVY